MYTLLMVILEVDLPVSSPDLPLVFFLTPRDALLLRVLPAQVQHVGDDHSLRDHQRAQGEGVAQHVRRFPVDLADHDARDVAHGLLQPDLHGAAVVRRHVDVEPGDVQPGAVVGCDGAEERCEVLDCVVFDGQEEDVADYGEDIDGEKELEKSAR